MYTRYDTVLIYGMFKDIKLAVIEWNLIYYLNYGLKMKSDLEIRLHYQFCNNNLKSNLATRTTQTASS